VTIAKLSPVLILSLSKDEAAPDAVLAKESRG